MVNDKSTLDDKSTIGDLQAENGSREGFSARLSSVLDEKRLKQVDLSNLSGESTSVISTYIRGQKSPSADSLIAIADALGVRPSWLLTGMGSRTETTGATMTQNLTSDGLNNQSMVTDNLKLFDIGTFASRLRDLMFPEKVPAFAARAGLPAPLVTKLLAAPVGVLPNAEVIARLRRATGATADWLISGIGDDQQLPTDAIRIPLYDVQFAGGAGRAIERENAIGDMPFDKALLASLGFQSADGLGVVSLKGDSMYPQIADGGRVLLNLADKQLTEGIFAFRLGDDLRIKRLRRVGIQGIEAISTNPIYPPELIDQSMMSHFELIGRAIWGGTKL